MKEVSNSVYTIAMGTGFLYTNTIENKVPKLLLKKYIKDKNILCEIENCFDYSYSIWGCTDQIMYESISEYDTVFFTYKNAFVYVGRVKFKFESIELSEVIWGNKERWKYKLVFENVVRIFIPDSKESFDHTLKNHEYIKKDDVVCIKKLHDRGYGFRYILSLEEDNNGYLESINRQKEKYETIMLRYADYCLFSNYECLIKEVK